MVIMVVELLVVNLGVSVVFLFKTLGVVVLCGFCSSGN